MGIIEMGIIEMAIIEMGIIGLEKMPHGYLCIKSSYTRQ